MLGTVSFPAKRKRPEGGFAQLGLTALDSYRGGGKAREQEILHTVPVYRLKRARHERMVGTLVPRLDGPLADPRDWPLACITSDPDWALGVRFEDFPLPLKTTLEVMKRVVDAFKSRSVPYSCLSMHYENRTKQGRPGRFLSLPILPYFLLHSPWEVGGDDLERSCVVSLAAKGGPLPPPVDGAYLRQLACNVEKLVYKDRHARILWRIEEQRRVIRGLMSVERRRDHPHRRSHSHSHSFKMPLLARR